MVCEFIRGWGWCRNDVLWWDSNKILCLLPERKQTKTKYCLRLLPSIRANISPSCATCPLVSDHQTSKPQQWPEMGESLWPTRMENWRPGLRGSGITDKDAFPCSLEQEVAFTTANTIIQPNKDFYFLPWFINVPCLEISNEFIIFIWWT